mgnify:CR=1 FL=1
MRQFSFFEIKGGIELAAELVAVIKMNAEAMHEKRKTNKRVEQPAWLKAKIGLTDWPASGTGGR